MFNSHGTMPEGDDYQLLRANGQVLCPICNQPYYQHPRYDYPSGLGSVVKSCELTPNGQEIYLHL